jgi:hypothetical protein
MLDSQPSTGSVHGYNFDVRAALRQPFHAVCETTALVGVEEELDYLVVAPCARGWIADGFAHEIINRRGQSRHILLLLDAARSDFPTMITPGVHGWGR